MPDQTPTRAIIEDCRQARDYILGQIKIARDGHFLCSDLIRTIAALRKCEEMVRQLDRAADALEATLGLPVIEPVGPKEPDSDAEACLLVSRLQASDRLTPDGGYEAHDVLTRQLLREAADWIDARRARLAIRAKEPCHPYRDLSDAEVKALEVFPFPKAQPVREDGHAPANAEVVERVVTLGKGVSHDHP